jgi:hypothetical protein
VEGREREAGRGGLRKGWGGVREAGRGRRGVRERSLPEYGTSDAGMNIGL